MAIDGFSFPMRTAIRFVLKTDPKKAKVLAEKHCNGTHPTLYFNTKSNLMSTKAKESYFDRYGQLQAYVGWSPEDATRIAAVKQLVSPSFPEMIDDFYATIKRTDDAVKVLTGGDTQINRLKQSLTSWINQLFDGNFDEMYVDQRLRVGHRHVEIGLDQVYTNVALSRLRSSINQTIIAKWSGDQIELAETITSVNRILDLDLAVIEDAYQIAHTKRQKQQERYATIGKVSGGIAHEIRNPLNIMKTSIYYLKNAKDISDEKRDKHISRIEAAIDDSNLIVTALSEFARLPEPNLTTISMEKLIQETIAKNVLPGEPFKNQMRFSVACSLSDDHILGESAQLLIAFGNLIRNACHAVNYEGEIDVMIGERNGKKMIAIKDNGIGIEEDNIKRILEPLFTTKPKGIGLGLAITKAIFDAHRAELTVDSKVGQGSEFAVLFPIREDV